VVLDYPHIKQGGNGPSLPNPQNATRKFQKNVAQVWKITNFDSQPALFNGASMGVHRDFLRFAS
jgi:hypothetical protein